MKNVLTIKLLAFVLIGLLIGASFSRAFNLEYEESTNRLRNRNTLYVGGTGPGNYSTIQSAINSANLGDTVFVYNGTYNENVVVNQSINLFGEDKNTTIIDGNSSNNMIFISYSNVNISGFTIQNSYQHGIYITSQSNNNHIFNNIIRNNFYGIQLFCCFYNKISNNQLIYNSQYGIKLNDAEFTEIYDNEISNNTENGISILQEIVGNSYICENNIVENNMIINNGFSGINFYLASNNSVIYNNISVNGQSGIEIFENSNNNLIAKNIISNHLNYGVWITNYCNDNLLYHNNFIANIGPNAYDTCINIWDNGYLFGGNYWDDYTGMDSNGDGIGDTPYDIPGGSNDDAYPLMNPYNEIPLINTTYVNDDADPSWYDSSHVHTIQEGITNVTEGGIVYVYSGMYYENLDVNKTLTLIGENQDTTIINSSNGDTVINVTANMVNITGFTIENASSFTGSSGIIVKFSSYVNISDNTILSCNRGITAAYAPFLKVSYIDISSYYGGVFLYFVNNATMENISLLGIINQPYDITGILFSNSNYNTIADCQIEHMDQGVNFSVYSYYNHIYGCLIGNCTDFGIRINFEGGENNTFYHNDFLNNTVNAFDVESANTWDNGYIIGGNYWDDYNGTDYDGNGIGDTSYSIPGGTSVDKYPLIIRWSGQQPEVFVDDDYTNTTPGWHINHFNTIMQAIDAVSQNGTVWVCNGTYFENLYINKKINLIGESRNNTIIDGCGANDVIYITANNVNISGFTFKNNNNYHHDDAIIDIRSSYNSISNNRIINFYRNGIYIHTHSINLIEDNLIQSSIDIYARGILLEIGSSYCHIKNNTLMDNYEGIVVIDGQNNYITGNHISNNSNTGIYFGGGYADTNTVMQNILQYNENGMTLTQSSNNNLIKDNLFENNTETGISLGLSSNSNIIDNNTFINDGLSIRDSYLNFVTNNTVNNEPLIYLEDQSNITISTAVGQIILINCQNITIENQNISNTTCGIELWNTTNSNIIFNNLFENNIGLYLGYSQNNSITNNTLINNLQAIIVEHSTNNTIVGNIIIPFANMNKQSQISTKIITNHQDNSILLKYSNNNNINENTLSYAGLFFSSSYQNIITNNTVNGRPLIYMEDQSDYEITNTSGQIILINCENITIQNQDISDTTIAILLWNSHNCLIYDNEFSDNTISGVHFTFSNNNIIYGNIYVNNDIGLHLNNSYNNVVYNNILQNNLNAFDNGVNFWNISETSGNNIIGGSYLGGNYWHDYTGIDLDEDGIGDTNIPYNSSGFIESGGDFLPLVPLTPPTTPITVVSTGWNFISVPFNTIIQKNDIMITYGGMNYTWIDAVTLGVINYYIFGWDRIGQYYYICDNLKPGFGYWIYASQPCMLFVENITNIPDEYITDLQSNWNIFSIPFNQSIDKIDMLADDVEWNTAVANQWVNNYLFGWNRAGQYYEFADTLLPGYAYWMYAYQPCTLKRAI